MLSNGRGDRPLTDFLGALEMVSQEMAPHLPKSPPLQSLVSKLVVPVPSEKASEYDAFSKFQKVFVSLDTLSKQVTKFKLAVFTYERRPELQLDMKHLESFEKFKEDLKVATQDLKQLNAEYTSTSATLDLEIKGLRTAILHENLKKTSGLAEKAVEAVHNQSKLLKEREELVEGIKQLNLELKSTCCCCFSIFCCCRNKKKKGKKQSLAELEGRLEQVNRKIEHPDKSQSSVFDQEALQKEVELKETQLRDHLATFPKKQRAAEEKVDLLKKEVAMQEQKLNAKRKQYYASLDREMTLYCLQNYYLFLQLKLEIETTYAEHVHSDNVIYQTAIQSILIICVDYKDKLDRHLKLLWCHETHDSQRYLNKIYSGLPKKAALIPTKEETIEDLIETLIPLRRQRQHSPPRLEMLKNNEIETSLRFLVPDDTLLTPTPDPDQLTALLEEAKGLLTSTPRSTPSPRL